MLPNAYYKKYQLQRNWYLLTLLGQNIPSIDAPQQSYGPLLLTLQRYLLLKEGQRLCIAILEIKIEVYNYFGKSNHHCIVILEK